MKKSAREYRRRAGRGSQGFSLVELMIALTIGLLVAAAIGYVFVASKQSFRTSQGMAGIQQSSREAFIIFNTTVRLAGFMPVASDGAAIPVVNTPTPASVFTGGFYAVFGGDPSTLGSTGILSWVTKPRATNSPYATGANIINANDSNNVPLNNDYLAVSFLGDGSTLTNCLGGGGPTGGPVASTDISLNVFYVDRRSTDSLPSLYCATESVNSTSFSVTSPRSTQPLIAGVSGLQVRYGVDVNGDGTADYYVTRSAVTSSNWPMVKSLIITLTTISQDQVAAVTKETDTSAAGIRTMQSGYLTRPVRETIYLRNRLQ